MSASLPVPPLVFALGALLMSSAAELLLRQAHARPIHEPGYMVVQTGAVFTTMGLFSAGGIGWNLTPLMAGLGVLSGVLGYLTGWSFLYAMGRGPTAVTSVVRRGGFVVTGLLAMIFLGEVLTVPRALAVALAVLAFAVMASDGDRAGRPHPILALTIISSGCMAFCHKLAAIAGVSASAFLMCQSGTAQVASHLVCLRAGGYRLTLRDAAFGAISGLCFAMGMVCAIYALRGADALVVAPVLQLSFLITAPGAFVLFREPVTARKLMGLGLGGGAVLLFGAQLG